MTSNGDTPIDIDGDGIPDVIVRQGKVYANTDSILRMAAKFMAAVSAAIVSVIVALN